MGLLNQGRERAGLTPSLAADPTVRRAGLRRCRPIVFLSMRESTPRSAMPHRSAKNCLAPAPAAGAASKGDAWWGPGSL